MGGCRPLLPTDVRGVPRADARKVLSRSSGGSARQATAGATIFTPLTLQLDNFMGAAHAGADRACDPAPYVTIGTGIGHAFVCKGEV